MDPRDKLALRNLLLHLHVHGATPEQLVAVSQAATKVMTAGIPWWQIFMTALSFILPIFTGGTIDIPGLIAAILALLNPPTPPPPVPPVK